MRTVERVLTGVLIVGVVAGAVAIAVLVRPGEGAPPSGGEQAAQGASGYPAPPEGTPPPSPGAAVPSAYPGPGDTAAPTRPTIVSTDAPAATPTPFWHWSTPEHPEGPTPTALPIVGPAQSPRGTIWTFELGDGGRLMQSFAIDPSVGVRRGVDLAPAIPARFWDLPPYSWPSPTGRYLALVSNDFESDYVYIVDLQTGEARHLQTMFQFGDVRWVETFFGAWHPDERRVYLCDKEYGMIFLVDVLGEEPRHYVSEALARGGVAVTPDGQQLAYATQPLGQSAYTLWFSEADGGGAKKVLEDPRDISVASWSPDGDRLLFLRGAQLWLVDRDGGNLRSLGVLHTGAWGLPLPQWSPDGALIAYSAEVVALEKKEGEFDPGMEFRYAATWLVNARTGEHRPLVPGRRVGDLYPAWSPDGRYVAFLSDRSGAIEVWATRVGDGSTYQITASGRTHSAPVWVRAEEG